MKTGFTPIPLREYVELHLHANPEVGRTELIQQLGAGGWPVGVHDCTSNVAQFGSQD